jgi:hypothetical protein
MSTSTEPAAPQTAEAARKTNVPRKKKRRLPKRSASRPAGISAAANTMLYALRIQESRLSEAVGNDARMSGNAMLTIVTSRKLMNTAIAVTSRTCQRRAMRLLTRRLLDASEATRTHLLHASWSDTLFEPC